MKKFFLLAAFGVAGLVSAKSEVVIPTDNNLNLCVITLPLEQPAARNLPFPKNPDYVLCESPCGEQFYMYSPQYSSLTAEIQAFNEICDSLCD